MIGKEAITQGGGGGGSFTVTSADETNSTSQDYNDTIDLGHSGPGGNQTFDLENNAAAAVETSETIKDAGGPGTVLAGTQEGVKKINKTVSELSGKIRDTQEQEQENKPTPDETETVTTTGIPKAQTAAANAANAAPAGGGPNGPDGLLGAVVAFLSSVLSGLFGGQ